MRKGSTNPIISCAGIPAPVLAMAMLALLLLAAGCTTSQPAPAPMTTIATTAPTPIPTTVIPTPTTESPDLLADQAFAAAADDCYNRTPAISNISTRLDFANCMQAIPLPPGNCAQNYRYYVLKATNEDPTTAGFARENEVNRLARDAYRRGEGYDGVNLTYAPCGDMTKIPSSFFQ